MTGEERPRLELDRSPFELVMEVTALVAIVVGAVLVFVAYPDLPDRVPRHFDGSMRPDGWGSKSWIFFGPVFGMVLWLVLSLIQRIPHRYNFPLRITAENAPRQYRLARELIVTLKALIALLGCFITWVTLRAAEAGESPPGAAVGFLVLLGATLVVPIIYVIRAQRAA